jgi:UDP-glucuronate decarboxylase
MIFVIVTSIFKERNVVYKFCQKTQDVLWKNSDFSILLLAMSTPFEKKNVIVTGGAGFIGSFLCESLLKNAHVICVDNFLTSTSNNIAHLLQNPDFEFIRADITKPIDLESYQELVRFKIPFQGVQEIYNLACPTSVRKFDEYRIATLDANTIGMKNVLELALKYKSKVFHASTSVVYGTRPADGHFFHEDEIGCFSHLTPRGCYDEGKKMSETMCQTYRDVYGLDIRIGRIFRTYGPRMPLFDGQMIPDFVVSAIDGSDLSIYGDETFKTTLAYVTDVVDGITAVMKGSENIGAVNIGSDVEIRIMDVAEKIIMMLGSSSKVVFEAPLPFMRELGIPDLNKAKNELGWLPLVSIDQGLAKLIEYAIAHKGLMQNPFG